MRVHVLNHQQVYQLSPNGSACGTMNLATRYHKLHVKQRCSMKISGLHDMVEDVRWYYRLWDTSYQPWPVLTLLAFEVDLVFLNTV